MLKFKLILLSLVFQLSTYTGYTFMKLQNNLIAI